MSSRFLGMKLLLFLLILNSSFSPVTQLKWLGNWEIYFFYFSFIASADVTNFLWCCSNSTACTCDQYWLNEWARHPVVQACQNEFYKWHPLNLFSYFYFTSYCHPFYSLPVCLSAAELVHGVDPDYRRLHLDLLFCYKIVFGLVSVNSTEFFVDRVDWANKWWWWWSDTTQRFWFCCDLFFTDSYCALMVLSYTYFSVIFARAHNCWPSFTLSVSWCYSSIDPHEPGGSTRASSRSPPVTFVVKETN